MDDDDETTAQEPLIGHQEAYSRDGRRGVNDSQVRDCRDTEVGGKWPSSFVLALTSAAGISGLLFGYDTGVISATLVSIERDLSSRLLSTLDKSLITASTSLFALIASPIAGWLADRVGRKGVILVADGLFIAGSAWQALTGSVWGMIAGRSAVGLAIGGASLVVPMYVAELSPAPFRGRLVTLSILFVTIGQVVSYLIGYLLSDRAHGWRWMVGLGALPAAVQILLLFAFLPESPRWLVKATRQVEAQRILTQVYGRDSNVMVSKVLLDITSEIREEALAKDNRATSVTPRKLPFTGRKLFVDIFGELLLVPSNREALGIACLVQALQQLCGFNSLMYYSATIFSLVGYTTPTLPSLSIALGNFIFTLFALFVIDRVGRRRMLLYTIPVMTLGLIGCAFAFTLIDTNRLPSSRSPSSIGIWPPLLMIFMLLFVAGYASGLGNIAWQQAELFPLSVRSQGSGLATATNWGCNFIVGLTFLPMIEWLPGGAAFVVYAVICASGFLAIRRSYPERRGRTLESTVDSS